MKRVYDLKNDEELKAAQWAAARGAVSGAARWGIYGAIAGIGAHVFSPVYRGLTIQFKIFLQMSAMIIGGVVHGDRRMQEHEHIVRSNNRLIRDATVWKRYEEDFEAEERRRRIMGGEGAGKRSSEEVDAERRG